MEKKISILILCFFTSLSFLYSQCVTQVVVNYVTVLPNGDVTISWQPSPDAGIVSYDIYTVNPITSANDSLTSAGAGSTTITIPYDTIVKYQITELGVAANCGGTNSPIGNNYHNVIELTHTIDICAASATLNWNAYDDFNSGLNVAYEVYISINGGAYALVGNTTNLTYTYFGLNQGTNYQFYVEAIENNGTGPFTSTSNVIDVTGNFLINPNFLYEYTATVIDSSHNQVLFYVDTTADIREYVVKRALANDKIYTTIASVPDFKGMNPLVEFNDYEVDAQNFSYFYQIYAVDVCNQTKFISNEGRTIQLSVESDPINAINTLTWNQYEGWQGNVNRYEIYRSTDEGFNYEFLTTYSIPGDSIMTFVDNVYDLIEGTGTFCYKIKAIEGVTNHVDNLPIANSTSNEDCVKHEPLIYIANAFNPGGDNNPTFKPSAILFDFTSYLFVIYDRWGKPVFETSNKDEAWNGQYFNAGPDMPLGAYVYVLKLNSTNGEEFVKRGTVTIVR